MALSRRAFLAGVAAAPAVRPPNVLVVMSDQESALLPGPVTLPNRRRLLERGVTFRFAFANTPQCSAARSSLLTGLEPHRTGVLTNVDASSLGKPLSPALPNVGSIFRAAGYSTGYFGKWHLGNEDHGLDAFGFSVYRPGKDERVAREAAQWIRGQSQPWLAWVSFLDPHTIYSLPARLASVRPRAGVKPPHTGLQDLAGKPSEQREYVEKDQGRATRNYTPEDWVRYRSFYCELVEKVDGYLGTLLEAAPGLDSTVVVYTSDHGDALGEHGLPFKGPFMYEEEISVPLLIAAPAGPRGERRDLVIQTDLAPTLAALAGVRWPTAVNGRDLTKACGMLPNACPDAVFLEYYAKQKWVNPIRTVRTRRWKLNVYDRGNKELYDLAKDPWESRNLAANPTAAAVQSQLEGRLNAWKKPMI